MAQSVLKNLPAVKGDMGSIPGLDRLSGSSGFGRSLV